MKAILLALCFTFATFVSHAAEEIPPAPKPFNPVSTLFTESPALVSQKYSLEVFNYEEVIYSGSKKTEIGDRVKLGARFRYQIEDNLWLALGFRTNPKSERTSNHATELELRAGYIYNNLTAQIDLQWITDHPNTGGMRIGLDLDSEDSFLKYSPTSHVSFKFYPFNLETSSGLNFGTGDVAQLYYISGAPLSLSANTSFAPTEGEMISKTLPGIDVTWDNFDSKAYGLELKVGFGLASYLYPENPGFKYTQASTSLTWERKQNFGYKLSALLTQPKDFFLMKWTGHTQSEETGSLLSQSLNMYWLSSLLSNFMVEAEVGLHKNGAQAFRLNSDGTYFEDKDPSTLTTVTEPDRIYADDTGAPQNWLDQWGWGMSVKLGKEFKGFTPYLGYKFENTNFVYEGRNSAHLLRTKNLELSHGGLSRLALGSHFYAGKMMIQAEFEYLSANEAVFSSEGQIRQARFTSAFKKQDFYFSIKASYFFRQPTGAGTFRLLSRG